MDKEQDIKQLHEKKLRYYQEEIDQVLKQEKAMAGLVAQDPDGRA